LRGGFQNNILGYLGSLYILGTFLRVHVKLELRSVEFNTNIKFNMRTLKYPCHIEKLLEIRKTFFKDL